MLLTAAIRGNTSGDGANIPYQYNNFFTGSPARLSWANIMTYDQWGAWESTTGYTAPYTWVTNALSYASSQAGGYQSQFMMGVPFYGAAWANVSNGSGTGGSGTPLGTVAYKDALNMVNAGGCTVNKPSTGNHYIYCSGTVSITYTSASSGNLVTENRSQVWISYDDATVMNTKATYVANSNYGGVMSWAQGNDSPTNDLSNAIDAVLDGSTGGTSGTWKQYANDNLAGYSLDGMGATTNGSTVGTYSNNSSTNQRWKAVQLSDGYYHVINETSGLCLDNMGSTTRGSNLGQWSCNTGINQEWSLVSQSGGWTQLQSHKSGMCADANNAHTNPVIQWTCGSTNANQLWKIQ
jgi:hypothetical protein